LDLDGDCADSKLIVTWLLGARDMDAALAFVGDLGRVLINQEARGAFDVRLSPNSGANADVVGLPRRANN
jgi:hypothetical protein